MSLRSKGLIARLCALALAGMVPGLSGSALAQLSPSDEAEMAAECGKGNYLACDRLAVHEKKPEVVAEALTKGCDAGEAGGCAMLGLAYLQGRYGFKQDRTMSVGFFERACNGNDVDSCGATAVSYLAGLGVPKDMAKAKAYYQKGCNLGDRNHCKSAKKIKVNKN